MDFNLTEVSGSELVEVFRPWEFSLTICFSKHSRNFNSVAPPRITVNPRDKLSIYFPTSKSNPSAKMNF